MSELATDLALERTAMAVERTLQAWVRTTLSMISFGFTIGKLGQAIEEIQIRGILLSRTVSLESLAFFLVGLGTLALLIATVQHQVAMRRLRARGSPTKPSLAVLVAGALILVGGGAFAALVFKL
jgi:putative membrane protein